MSKTNQLVLVQPDAFFHEAVSGAMSELKVRASEPACSYLVQLLSNFIQKENLFPQNGPDTLAMQLANALEEDSPEIRRQKYKQMGDFSLYMAGFFSDSFTRKLVDVDYYIEMGGAAYDSVARMQGDRELNRLFAELAGKFPKFVDVLAQVSEGAAFYRNDSKALLRLYDLWLKTGSERVAKQLVKAGLVPTPTKGDDDDKQ
jgi:hypothetical protein